MTAIRFLFAAALFVAAAIPSRAADDIADAIEQARKAYQAGDLPAAKQQLDMASQLIGQKNAEALVALLPEPLPGWQGEKPQTQAISAAMFGGASAASRSYTNAKGDDVEVSITGDSAMLMSLMPMLSNPAMAGAMGKLIRVGGQRAIQTHDGDIMMLVNGKFVINIRGSADTAAKLTYAKAVDIAKLSKM